MLIAVAPASMRDWIEGMLREADGLPSRQRLAWNLAAARVALGLRIRRSALVLQAGTLASFMVAVDWAWGAMLPALLLIGASAAALTRGPVRRSHVALLVASGTLPLAHAVANWVPSLRPRYQFAPLDLKDWATLAAVAAIGLCAVRISEAMWRAYHLIAGDR